MATPATASTRSRVTEVVGLLASAAEQFEYERAVPHVAVVDELIESFVTDTYHPKSPDFIAAFSESELRDLAELFGLVRAAGRHMRESRIASVAQLQKLPEWRSVMARAKQLQDSFRHA